LNSGIFDSWKRATATVHLSCRSKSLQARGRPAAATDCITSYRRSLLTMSQAAAAALIVRGVPTEHRPSKTSTATAVAMVMRWKLSTAVAMSAAMTETTLLLLRSICGTGNSSQQTSLQCFQQSTCYSATWTRFFLSFCLKAYTAKKFTDAFPQKRWTKRGVNKLLQTSRDTGTVYRGPEI